MNARRVQLRRVATLWDCTADYEVTGPWTAIMWEPLNVQPPLSAKPYCCYISTVIFYRDKVGYDELARCDALDLHTVSPTLVFLGGRWWEVSGGQVVQRDGVWCMRHNLSANTRLAIQCNTGREAERAQQLATVN